jgi:hypothetical protein
MTHHVAICVQYCMWRDAGDDLEKHIPASNPIGLDALDDLQ